MSAAETPLLHSLTTFSRLIVGSLDIVNPRRIVEIGSESGGFTLDLEAWASRSDAHVMSIDPDPAPSTVELGERSPHLELVSAASPQALAGLEPAQVYVIDGDHNYATVSAELHHALGGGNQALAVMHDVGWPCARRDQYYAPERLEPAQRHDYSYRGGVKPDRGEVGPGGIRGAGDFAYAQWEGGERNGVLTAAEDFMAAHEGLRLIRIPCVFGLGFLFPAAAPWAEPLTAFLEPFDEHPLLSALEENRIALYLRVLDLQDALEAERRRADRVITGLQDEIGTLEAAEIGRSLGAQQDRLTPVDASAAEHAGDRREST